MDDKQKLIQVLLNTKVNDTNVVKQSERELEECESSPQYPLLLGEIINENQNHQSQIDLIAVLSLGRFINRNYK